MPRLPRDPRRLLLALLLVAVAAVTGLTFLPGDRSPSTANRPASSAPASRAVAALRDDRARATVDRVVDGDTVVVRFRDRGETRTARVRYLGVDTPETVHPQRPIECFGPQASDANRRWVAGRRVRLRFDRAPTDRYGRLLAAVVPEGWDRSVGERLVADGLARVMTIAPNRRWAPRLERLADDARRHGRGLWGACAAR